MWLSRTVVHGLYALCYLGRQKPGVIASAKCIAEAIGTPVHSCGKVLQGLAEAGLVTAHRGRRGGYVLAVRLEHVSLADLYDALYPSEDRAELAPRPCPVTQQRRCDVHDRLVAVCGRIEGILGDLDLADLVAATCPSDILASAPG